MSAREKLLKHICREPWYDTGGWDGDQCTACDGKRGALWALEVAIKRIEKTAGRHTGHNHTVRLAVIRSLHHLAKEIRTA